MQQYTPNQQNLQNFMANLNIAGLKTKIIFTLVMIAIFRFCAQLPLYGIDTARFSQMATDNNLIGFLDMFSGGALGSVSIIALGIGPYITSSIIIQLLTIAIPFLEEMSKDGDDGRKKLNKITRYVTILLALIESIGLTVTFERSGHMTISGVFGYLVVAVTLTAGSTFVMWLGEKITVHGVGNGISVILLINIVSGMPGDFTTRSAARIRSIEC